MLKPRNSFAKEYHLKKSIDTKGLAEVWEAASAKNHIVDSVALKIFPWVRTVGIKEIEAAFAKQPYFDHNNLLSAKRLGIYENRPFLEMHFCNNGNISKRVLQLTEKEIVKCLYQTAGALAYLHENSVMHGAIKPDNILIDGESYYLYLADLGLSPEIRKTIEHFMDVDTEETIIPHNTIDVYKGMARTGFPCFFAPELFENNPVPTMASDVWALGASIFEMVTGRLPFGYLGGEAQRINNFILKDIMPSFSADLNMILKICLSKNKEDRPTAQAVEEMAKDLLKGKKIAAFAKNPKSIVVVEPIISTETFEPAKPIFGDEIPMLTNINELIKPVYDVKEEKLISGLESINSSDVIEKTRRGTTVEPSISSNPFEQINVEQENFNAYIEPINAITANEEIKPATDFEPIKPAIIAENERVNLDTEAIFVDATKPKDVEQSSLATDIDATSHNNGVEPIRPIVEIEVEPAKYDVEPSLSITIIKPIIPVDDIEQEKSTTFSEPINDTDAIEKVGTKATDIVGPIKPITVAGPVVHIKEPITLVSHVEPLKQIIFSTDRPPVAAYNNLPKEKRIKWKGVFNIVVPSIVAGIILFVYIKLSSNLPEYTLVPASTYTIKPVLEPKKDTGHTTKKMPATKAIVVTKKLPHIKKPYLPVASPNAPVNTTKVTSSKPVVQSNGTKTATHDNTKKAILQVASLNYIVERKETSNKPVPSNNIKVPTQENLKRTNLPVVSSKTLITDPKAVTNKTIVQSKNIIVPAQENTKQSTISTAKKRKHEEKEVDYGIPKKKDNEQVIDPGIPKRRDQEQKINKQPVN